jgi:hypothetical protein
MLAGDTLVTISLADSLFLSISSISPHELKSRVLLYLVVTLAPFAVVCPCSGRSSTASAGAGGPPRCVRLPVGGRRAPRRTRSVRQARDPLAEDLARLRPLAPRPLALALGANALLRGLAGFFAFLLALGLRRAGAPLIWYGFALGASGVGSLLGLVGVPRLSARCTEYPDPPPCVEPGEHGRSGERGAGGPSGTRAARSGSWRCRVVGPALVRRRRPAPCATPRTRPGVRPRRHPSATGLGARCTGARGGGLPTRGRRPGRGCDRWGGRAWAPRQLPQVASPGGAAPAETGSGGLSWLAGARLSCRRAPR